MPDGLTMLWSFRKGKLNNCGQAGNRSPSRAISRTNLAILYQKVGRFDGAMALDESTLQMKQSTFGEHHPETLTSMNNLATVYRDIGCLKDALALQAEVVEVISDQLEGDYPHELLSMTNVALLYQKMGRLDEVVELARSSALYDSRRSGGKPRMLSSGRRNSLR